MDLGYIVPTPDKIRPQDIYKNAVVVRPFLRASSELVEAAEGFPVGNHAERSWHSQDVMTLLLQKH